MRIIAIIPSRYASQRFAGKSIAPIAGIPMIQRVYRQVEKAGCFEQIIVATDDQRIAQIVEGFGGVAVLTSSDLRSGTERVWAVMKTKSYGAVVNIQGDEPLISEELVAGVHQALVSGKTEVVTAAFWSISYEDFVSPHVVKVVLNRENQALYFSRSPIPYAPKGEFSGFYQHVGIYGYTRDALDSFFHSTESSLEKSEKLEQLRFLEGCRNVQVLITPYRTHGVDVPGDVDRIEKILREQGE